MRSTKDFLQSIAPTHHTQGSNLGHSKERKKVKKWSKEIKGGMRRAYPLHGSQRSSKEEDISHQRQKSNFEIKKEIKVRR